MKLAGGVSIDWISLSNSAKTTLFQQLCDQLRDAVLAGNLAPGSRLPSTRVLAREARVSRNTAVNAYQQLIAEGYLVSQTGSGTRVADVVPQYDFKARTEPPPSGRVQTAAIQAYGGAFSPSLPAVDAFPYAVWRRINNRLWKSMEPADWMGYGDTAGFWPLREGIAAHLHHTRGVRCTPEQVLVVNGSQQALDLVSRLLIARDDPVWFEDPGYAGAREALRYAGANLTPVPVDEQGMDVEYAIAHNDPARLVFVTPSHQYPLGSVLSLQRRTRLLEWANATDAWILEDDYNSDFRYIGKPLMSLQGLDSQGRVIYMGTFSKVLFPALRLGYLVLPKALVEPFLRVRTATDGFAPTFPQAVLAEFIEQGYFDTHLRRMRGLYAQRQQHLLEKLKPLAGVVDVSPSDAGMHLVARLPPTVRDVDVSRAAAEQGITTHALSTYYMGSATENGLILGYAGFEQESTDQAISRLSQIILDRVTSR
ncbi:MAG: PLP-dependent aminotransferase family protein [Pseudomonadota bacterium]